MLTSISYLSAFVQSRRVKLILIKMMSKIIKTKVPRREFSSVSLKSVWTSDNVVKSPCKEIVIPKMRIDEYMWRNLDKWHSKIATVCGITNRSYTYNELHKKSKTFAANLKKKFKIENGDTVGVMMKNSPEFPAVVLGIIAAGGIVTPYNPVYTPCQVEDQRWTMERSVVQHIAELGPICDELERLITLSEAKLIIADPDIIPTVTKALDFCKKDMPIIAADLDAKRPENTVSYKELIEDNNIDLSILKDVKRNVDDVSVLPYSSGTTGLPKAVEISHYNIVSNCEQQNTELRQYYYTTDSHQDTTLALLPMFHSYGLGIIMMHKLSVGLKLVTLPKFHPETFINAISKYQLDLLYTAPPILLFLATNENVTKTQLERLRLVVCGGAPVPPSDIQALLEKSKRNIDFSQGYGMTEASPLVSVNAPGQKEYKTAGYAMPNIDLRIVDGNMNNLGPDEVGELVIKGPNIMKGYKNNPQANSEVFLEEGWFRSGDLAKIDQNGVITIADRLKELIKVNAYQVPPAELEYVIKEHPAVLDAGVIGIPDDVTGERPKAFVVLKPGIKATEKDLIEFVKQRVAPYKKVKEVVFVESLPKNLTGKILRKVLKEKYC